MSDDDYETFVCTSCGIPTTRLKGSFDFPICAECRVFDEIDPTGNLKRTRQGQVKYCPSCQAKTWHFNGVCEWNDGHAS
jgi:hypothetical protein